MGDLHSVLRATRKNIVLTIIVTVILFVSSQFVVLATVSTRGADMGKIRDQQERIRLENETLRSQISQSKTLQSVTDGLEGKFATEQIKPKPLKQ